MSATVGLQLAVKRQNEELIENETASATVIQSRISAMHSYQRHRQQQQQRLLQQIPPQQHIQSHRHQLPQQQQQQQPRQPQPTQQQQQQPLQKACEADAITSDATTTTTTTIIANATNMRLAAVQSKRKEKARIAARARRSQEASIIMEMAGELCISQEKLRRIDKATIVKLAIDYIKAHGVLCSSPSAQPSLCSQTKQLKNSHNNHINEQRHRQSTQLQQIYNSNDNDDAGNDDNEDESDDVRADGDERRRQQQLQKMTQHHRPAAVAGGTELARPQLREEPQQQQQQQQQPLYSAPKLATASIFAPKTVENMNPHFLMIEEKDNGKGAFVLKPDTEILDEDDLTHLAPQAGDISISLEVEPLEGIPFEDLLIPSPTSMMHQQQHQQQLWMR